MKNIPIPSERSYLKCLTDKVENFIRRIRWKAFWYEKKQNDEVNDDTTNTSTYGFKSPKTPPMNIHLKLFENDLCGLIQTLEFTPVRNNFQSQLRKDMKDVRTSKNILVFADKSTNLYEVSKEEYNKILDDNITKTYKKAHNNTKEAIDREAKSIANNLGLSDRMERFAERPAFVTLKDHKEDFRSNPKCRLINPAKSEVGHISKAILEKVVASVAEASGLNQWRSTSSVINWFKAIKYKGQSRFIKFDICDFYPSITENLLDKAIAFAKKTVTITDQELGIIKHARKSLLFSNSGTWVKKGDDLFDVTMGSHDGAEVCELVGLYLLDRLALITGKTRVGLYRDDGLSVIKSSSGRRLDKLRKDIVELFKSEGLSITIETNLQSTDFLDVTLNLSNGKYYPFRKPNSQLLYINANSNHPSNIIEELPNMINRRISDLSCDADEFRKAKAPYESALKASGHEPDFEFARNHNNHRTRNRKVLWFNPPFSKSVKTNIGKQFLNLVRKHFTRRHPFSKIFNTNTLKLSYSCMPNVQNIIKQANVRNLQEPQAVSDRQCNCNVPENCPLDGNCCISCIAYEATVKTNNKEFIYFGISDDEWKKRFSFQTMTFRKREYEGSTELSKFIWSLQDKGESYSIKWRVAAQAHSY